MTVVCTVSILVVVAVTLARNVLKKEDAVGERSRFALREPRHSDVKVFIGDESYLIVK